jgi:hypothetical protein
MIRTTLGALRANAIAGWSAFVDHVKTLGARGTRSALCVIGARATTSSILTSRAWAARSGLLGTTGGYVVTDGGRSADTLAYFVLVGARSALS